MERLGEMTPAAHSEKPRIPLAADGREICIHFLSKGDCIRSCTRSHAPVRVQSREAVICYIRIDGDVTDPSRKRKSNGGGYRGSHGVNWERSRVNGIRNLEGHNHGNGA